MAKQIFVVLGQEMLRCFGIAVGIIISLLYLRFIFLMHTLSGGLELTHKIFLNELLSSPSVGHIN